MRPIPPQLRKEMDADAYYHQCARHEALRDHECRPDPLTGKLIEWEHAIIFAGRQLNEKWAIVPICWLVHRGGYMVKEINEWLALRRAPKGRLKELSKAVDYEQKLRYLNQKYA